MSGVVTVSSGIYQWWNCYKVDRRLIAVILTVGAEQIGYMGLFVY